MCLWETRILFRPGDVNFSVLHIASSIAVFQALLMALFSIQNKKSPRTSNIFLASMLFAFALISGASLYKSITPLETHMKYHRQIFVVGQLAFCIGPLLYLYVKSLLDLKFFFRKKDWIHFLPVPVAIVSSLAVFPQYHPFLIWKFPGRIYFSGAVLVQSLAYCVASFKIMASNGLTVKSFLSYIDNSRLEWVRFLVGGYIILWIMQLQIFMAWDVLEQPQWCPYVRSLYFLTTFLLFNGLVYIGLKKPELFQQGLKYQYSVLKESDKELYQNKLTGLMSAEKLFLNPSLSLTEIAQKLEVAPRYASQVINESFRQNFHDFVNRFRVEESKRLLSLQDQNLNILGIALDAGFNSKSAFNTAFKRHTGMTPKEFRKSVFPDITTL